MTLIGAKKINGKWTMLADSAATIGQVRTDAGTCYRPKIRKIEGKSVTIYAGSCGTIKDIDYVTNIIEKKLAKAKIKNTFELKFLLQEALAEGYSSLKLLTSDPAVSFLFLEPTTDTLFIGDEYSVSQPEDFAAIVIGSGDQSFYKAYGRNADFYESFKQTVECDEYCDMPIVAVRDEKVKRWWGRGDAKEFYNYYYGKDETPEGCSAEYNCTPVLYSDPDEQYISRGTNKEL